MNVRAGAPARIGFCITELEPGGAERCLVELVTRLNREQFDPVVYCLGPRPASNPTSLADVLEQAGVRVHCFNARRSLHFVSVLRKLRRQMAADAPIIVQSFLFHANVLGTVAAHLAGVPHLVTGIRVAERRAGWHLAVVMWTDRWVQRHVCVSQAVREFSRREGRLSDEKLVVIPNGVDVERFAMAKPCSPAVFDVETSRRLITYVGRLDAQKGVAWLLEQMPAIFASLPDHDLLLVGTGPERVRLERKVRLLALHERVHFAGFRWDVPEILAASDLCLLASRWEGMPNAILEAMASGKPVVATQVEGVAEALGAGAADQTVPRLDAEAFVAKAVAILSNPQLAARLGRQNQDRARQCFELAAMARAYEQLYTTLLAADRDPE